MKKLILLLSKEPELFGDAFALLESEDVEVKWTETLPELMELCGKHPCLAVLLDLETAEVDNRSLKLFSRRFPDVTVFAVSEKQYHPDLQEAMQQMIYACLRAPIDPEELSIVLKGIGNRGGNG